MNTRERFHAIINFQPFDRLPLLEWAGWWDKTIDRWHTEGLPASLTDRYAICRHFGLDLYKQGWFSAHRPDCPQPTAHGSGIITSDADYERIRPHLYPAQPVNVESWQAWAKEQQEGWVVLWFTVDGFFWFARHLLGIERHLYAFYDQPELLHRINSDLAEWLILVIEQVCSICTPDFMTFAEDMSYNNGSMLSKQLFQEFMRPYYARVIPTLRKHGIITIIDSDGDISVPAHWFGEAGLDGILPLERQAGVDIGCLRKEHPRMKFIGHFDKMTMDKGKEDMRAEFERLLPTAANGGFLPSCDHQTPPGVSYDNYRIYLDLFKEYAEKAGRMSHEAAKPGVPDDA
ncbi:MAG: uroporphyrinogen decarboxylase family protein [Verrucomicrobiota bacterium]